MIALTPKTEKKFVVAICVGISSGSPSPVSFEFRSMNAAMSSKTWFCSFQSKKFPRLITFCCLGSRRLLFSQTITRRSALPYGNDRSSTACTTLKTAVLAPIPSPSVITETRVNAGRFKRLLTAYRISLISDSITSSAPTDHFRLPIADCELLSAELSDCTND